MLRVTNWLHKPQRFHVIIQRKVADVATQLEGSEWVDVPALCNKEYRLNFYAYTQVGGMRAAVLAEAMAATTPMYKQHSFILTYRPKVWSTLNWTHS